MILEGKNPAAAIEAVLFAMGSSVELPRIAAAIGMDSSTPRIPNIRPPRMMNTRIITEDTPSESPKSFGFSTYPSMV